MKFQSLADLFSRRKPPPVLTDSDVVRRIFGAGGFEVLDTNEVLNQTLPSAAIVITTKPDSLPPGPDLTSLFANSAILDIPLTSFEASLEAIEYLYQRLSTLNFSEACAKSMQIVETIEYATKPIVIRSGGAKLNVDIGKEVSIALPKLEPNIFIGEWISISQFLEVGLIPNEEYSSFEVSGMLVCDGASVAHHRMNEAAAQPLAAKAWSIFENIRSSSGFPLEIVVESSRVITIRTSTGEDILHKIHPLIDEVFHGMLIEVAFASLPPSNSVDWCINSQINEASGGLHLALGTGVHAAHIDFIASRAKIDLQGAR
jgi:hypothetical protein